MTLVESQENDMEITGSHATGNTEESIVQMTAIIGRMITTDLTSTHGKTNKHPIKMDLMTFKTPKPWIKALLYEVV
jgi:hypothetical protein